MNEDKSIMVKCACGGDALEVTYWPNKDCPDELWFAIWRLGYNKGLCWRERFRWCWNILRTGRPYSDDIILNPEQGKQIADFINQNVKPTK